MNGEIGKMKNLFSKTSANWVRYSRYEWKKDSIDVLYITPSDDARPTMYSPLMDAEQLVLDAVDIGIHCMQKEKHSKDGQIKEKIMSFIVNYGLLGLMTALPTTPEFIQYEAVYFPKNHFIKEESLTTERYLSYFFPFDKIDFRKKGKESSWSVTDTDIAALIMATPNNPQAVTMSFQKEYAERYDWLVTAFTDWAFTFFSSFLYYQDFNQLNELQKEIYRQGMAAFGGIAPTYHIELATDGPQIVWDFHSLLLGIQMMFSFMLTDAESPMKVCKHCGKAFIASRPSAVFCSPQCKNRFNVYKSRAKDKDKIDE